MQRQEQLASDVLTFVEHQGCQLIHAHCIVLWDFPCHFLFGCQETCTVQVNRGLRTITATVPILCLALLPQGGVGSVVERELGARAGGALGGPLAVEVGAHHAIVLTR